MRIVTILFLIVALNIGVSAKISSSYEDKMIMKAIIFSEQGNYSDSIKTLLKLYDKTKDREYLYRATDLALNSGSNQSAIITRLKHLIPKNGAKVKDLTPIKLLASLYLKNKNYKLAEKLVDKYLKNSDDPEILYFCALVKKRLKKYKEAVELYKKSYDKSLREPTLIDLTTIMDKNLNQRDKAIRMLESHRRMNSKDGIDDIVAFKLIELYAKANRMDKVIDIYKELYKKYHTQELLQRIVKLSLLTRDLDGLVKFLEQNSDNKELLYMLYKEQKDYKKAIALAKELYSKTKEPKWLAEEAILTYEEAKEKNKITPEVLNEFQKLFKEALKEGANESLYLNYYGYTLIEHNIDLDEGIKLVKEALKQQPKNAYYIDSLAWGLYKKGDCRGAYNQMKKIYNSKIFKREKEIQDHFKEIEKCIKKQK